jgi:transcriptional regulator
MYRPPQNAVDEPSALHRVIRSFPFATIAVAMNGRIEFAYAPVVLDAGNGPLGGVRFHLARANRAARLADAEFWFSFRGPDAYISPDWYRSASMVPTWNYVAVEGIGRADVLDESQLRGLLIDLSAQEEAKLAPKKPWTIDKVPADRQALLLKAIVGFSVRFDKLEGKFKLSQEKSQADFEGARTGLEGRGDPGSLAIASAMKTVRDRV